MAKVAHIHELQAARRRVLFIEDGTNDTPALAAVDISTAPISCGHACVRPPASHMT